jgi:hypothetical protein
MRSRTGSQTVCHQGQGNRRRPLVLVERISGRAAIGEQPGIGHFRKALLTPRRDGEPGCGNEKCMQRGSHGNPFREIPIVTPAVFVQGVAR